MAAVSRPGFTGPIAMLFGEQAIPPFALDADGILQDEHIEGGVDRGRAEEARGAAQGLKTERGRGISAPHAVSIPFCNTSRSHEMLKSGFYSHFSR